MPDTKPVNPDLVLRYNSPAKAWEEALPIGSSKMGAMVFGGVPNERIQFNEETLWTGKPHDYVRAGAGDHLKEIRDAVFAGDGEKANTLVRSTFLSDPVRQKAYQPFGDLKLTVAHNGSPSDYERTLDLDSAVAVTTYKIGSVTHRREVFCSYPAGVLVTRISADQAGQVAVSVELDCLHKSSKVEAIDDSTLRLTGQVEDPVPTPTMGMKFEGRVRAIVEGGKSERSGNTLVIRGANAVTLIVAASTNFKNWQDISDDESAKCAKLLDAAASIPYEKLLADHLADHRKLFRSASLDLGRTDAAKHPTSDRLGRLKQTSSVAEKANNHDALAKSLWDDPSFITLFFQLGRYLLITSSRPGGMPANLQGVWNELLNPPWEGKYTTNINVEMNYWPAEVCNIGETHEALFDMIDDLRVSGARTAKKQYNAGGWVVHHNTDHWRGTAPINNIDGMWQTGGAWLSYHLWEHYLFTQDVEFLAKRAFPAMKEAAQFFLDALTPHPKHTQWLVTCPTHSPEQGPLTAGTAMDMQLIRSLFDGVIEGATTLNTDADFVAKIKETRAKLVPDQIGGHGQLQEWLDDIDVPNNNHRHMSPLWGLYPGAQFTPQDPKMFDAVKTLLNWRGDGSTGWSYAWRMPLHARIGDGEFALRQLVLQLQKRTMRNLFDLCGPFQIDGNFGACAGIAEMLLQSHQRVPEHPDTFIIDILPALPKSWVSGEVKGLRARGGFELNFKWKDGALVEGEMISQVGRPCRLRLRGIDKDIATIKGNTSRFNNKLEVQS